MPDIYLRSVPSDANSNDVRLRDPTTAGSSSVTGTIAITQAGDTWALTGAALVSGTAAITQAGDTWALTGAARVSGAIAVSQAADTWSLTGAARVSGTAAITQAGDTWALTSVALVPGTIVIADADDTWAATGTAGAVTVQQPGYDGGSYARQRGYGRFGRGPVHRLNHATPPEERVFVGKSRAQVLELQLLLLG